jgi:hypothetical protein
MRIFKHLTQEERYHIYLMIKQNTSISDIVEYTLDIEFTKQQFFNFIVVIGFPVRPIFDSEQNACDCSLSVVKHYVTDLFVIHII